jgi:hypothetical protein
MRWACGGWFRFPTLHRAVWRQFPVLMPRAKGERRTEASDSRTAVIFDAAYVSSGSWLCQNAWRVGFRTGRGQRYAPSCGFDYACNAAKSGRMPMMFTTRRRAAKQRYELAPSHSITSSAMATSPGGKVSPSELATLRLISSSNLADCTTGSSLGCAPRKILPL